MDQFDMNLDGTPVLNVAGVDEVGRGPLAGPVMAAAVILDPQCPIEGLADSKVLSEKRREALYEEICEYSLAYAVGRAEVEEIEAINILNASLLAMQRAVEQLSIAPSQILVDGNRCPQFPCPAQAIIKGDQKVASISAASIVAKVLRDREMESYEDTYPGYGFAAHKGYGTRAHREALQQLGVTPIHRRSFAGVKELLIA